jgi:hypothetical protein
LIGPIKPPLAFEAASDTSPARRSERFPGQQPMTNVIRLCFRRVILGHVDAAISRPGPRIRISAQHEFRGCGEFVLVRVVIRMRLVLGHADLGHDFVLLHAALEHVLFELPPQVRQGHPLPASGLLELFIGVDVVVLLDVVEDALELLVRHDVAELAATLNEEELIDRTENQLWRAFRNCLLQLRAVGGDVLKLRGVAGETRPANVRSRSW